MNSSREGEADGRTVDMTGRVFGRLTVVGAARRNNRLAWLCRCACGEEKTVAGHYLRDGRVVSCGCYCRELNAALHTKHGGRRGPGARDTKPPEYMAWQNMRRRCESTRDREWPNYGARGITVCDRWRSDFAAFLTDVGPRPSVAHSIDRIDNAGNYEPGNVRWATLKQQARNKRSNCLVTAFGETMTVAEWSERLGTDRKLIYARVSRGWSGERAVTPRAA